MNVYHLLRPETGNDADFDEVEGFVVVAETSQLARDLVACEPHCGDEGAAFWMSDDCIVNQIGFALPGSEAHVVLRAMHGS